MARAETDSITWPQTKDGEPALRGPDGIDHHVSPLAFLATGPDGIRVIDCRRTFQPLTAGPLSKDGDTMYGALAIEADLEVEGAGRFGALYGPVKSPAAVDREALAEGAVSPDKLADDVGTVPAGYAILGPSAAPAGYEASGFATTLHQSKPGWAAARRLPHATAGAISAAALGGRVYTLLESGELWRYDPARDSWRELEALSESRSGCALAVAQGKLWVAGGRDASGRTTASLFQFDPNIGRWEARAPMPTARRDLSLAAFDGRLFAAGGRRDWLLHGLFGPLVSRRLEVYDPLTDQWSRHSALPRGRFGAAAVASGGRLHLIGGEGRLIWGLFGRRAARRVARYDIFADRWQGHLAALPSPRRFLAAAHQEGRIYTVGGQGPLGASAETEAYDPATDTFSPLPAMPSPAAAPGLALVDGHLVAIGGALEEATVPVTISEVETTLYLHRKTGIPLPPDLLSTNS